jgi:hypothetical protein
MMQRVQQQQQHSKLGDAMMQSRGTAAGIAAGMLVRIALLLQHVLGVTRGASCRLVALCLRLTG